MPSISRHGGATQKAPLPQRADWADLPADPVQLDLVMGRVVALLAAGDRTGADWELRHADHIGVTPSAMALWLLAHEVP